MFVCEPLLDGRWVLDGVIVTVLVDDMAGLCCVGNRSMRLVRKQGTDIVQ